MKQYAGKWSDYWCWMKVRSYICQRPAKRSGGSEDSTARTLTSIGVVTQPSATSMFCGVDRTTWPPICTSRAEAKTDEIEREIKSTQMGYSAVIDNIVLKSAGTPWLGGSAAFADLAQSAIDFGRSFGKLSAEVRPGLVIGSFYAAARRARLCRTHDLPLSTILH